MRVSGHNELWCKNFVGGIVFALCLFFTLTACRSELFPRESRVDSGAIRDVRSIGEVLAEATTEEYWDGLTTVIETIVVKVDAGNAEGALEKAGDLLVDRNWSAVAQRFPAWVQMESGKWEKTQISLSSVKFVLESSGVDPEKKKAIAEATAQARPETLVVLDVYRKSE